MADEIPAEKDKPFNSCPSRTAIHGFVVFGAAESRQRLQEQELATYKALKVPAASDNPFLFWKHKATDYPILSQAAMRIICITASFTQSVRDFSSVEHTVTDMRSCLSADKV